MDQIQVPEDVTSLSDEELAALVEQVSERGRALAESARDGGLTEEVVAEVETLGTARNTLVGEQTARAERAAELEDRFGAALAGFEDEPEGEIEEAEEEAPEPVLVEAAAEVVVPDEVIPAPAAPAPVAAAAAPAPAAPARKAVSTGRLSTRRGEATAPKPAPERESFMFATGFAQGTARGASLDDPNAVAAAMVKTLDNWGRSQIPMGTREFTPVATSAWERKNKIGPDAVANLSQINEAISSAQAALVASGPCCTPLSPSYDFFRLVQPQSPVEDFLPVVQAPRGGVRWITTPDWRDALDAIGIQCCGDNDDPENPLLKPCLHISCPEVAEATVCAVSRCVEIDNLQYRTFPELIDNFLADTAVAFTWTKETSYLDSIHAGSTVVTGFNTTYGAARQLVYNLTMAAAGYRGRNGMRSDALIQALLPGWVREVIKTDMLMNGNEGLGYLNVSDAAINAAFRSRNIDPVWYVNTATNKGQAFTAAQAAGTLNEWPANMVAYLFAPGTWVRMDGGTLDLGLVRDSTLNRRNDLQLFMEEWTGVIKVGIESVALVVPACPNGVGPLNDDAFTC